MIRDAAHFFFSNVMLCLKFNFVTFVEQGYLSSCYLDREKEKKKQA